MVKSKALWLLLMAVMLPATRAFAQDDQALLRDGLFARDRNVAVTQRPHKEYTPLSFQWGAFTVLPAVTGTVEANDNIYGFTTGEISDTIFHINPSVTATSTWSRNALVGFASVNSNLYSSHSSENTTDFVVGARGRLDVQRDMGLAGGASFERDTEPRTSSSSPVTAIHPVRYDIAKGYAEGTYGAPRWRLTGRLDVEEWTYDNGVTSAGGLVYQKDRDHTVTLESGRLEYAVVPDTSVFVNAVVNQRSYHNALVGEALRDSSGYDLTVGANFDLSHTMRGEAMVGYLNQDYDDARFPGVSGLSARGRVEWFPTQLTTVSLLGARGVADSGIVGAAGYLTTNVSASIDHELLRNLVISGSLGYGKDEYKGYDRKDERTLAGLSAKYLMNRAVTINLVYSYYDQTSTGAKRGLDFTVNKVLAALTYAF